MTTKPTPAEIEQKILKEVNKYAKKYKEKDISDEEELGMELTNFTAYLLKKAISLTLAECQKQNYDYRTCAICGEKNDDNASYVCSKCSYRAMKRKVDECQKQNSDFVKKLKEEIKKVDCYCSDYNPKCNRCIFVDKLDNLAKEFNIKQVGEE